MRSFGKMTVGVTEMNIIVRRKGHPQRTIAAIDTIPGGDMEAGGVWGELINDDDLIVIRCWLIMI